MLMTTFKSCLIAPCCEEVTEGTNAILLAFDKLQVASMGGRILFGSFLSVEMSDNRSRRRDRSILLHCSRSRQSQMLKIQRRENSSANFHFAFSVPISTFLCLITSNTAILREITLPKK